MLISIPTYGYKMSVYVLLITVTIYIIIIKNQ